MDTSRILAACGALAFALQITPAAADSGPWYVGAGAGAATYGLPRNYTLDQAGTATQPAFQLQFTNKDSATAYRLDGGYRFGKYFALEGLYADFGSEASSFKLTSPKFSATGSARVKVWGAEAVGRLPLADGFSVFARAGLVRFHTDFTALTIETNSDPFNPPPTIFSVSAPAVSTSGTTGVLGAGADYDFTGNWSLRAAFDYFQGKNGSHSYMPGVHLVSIELLYHFN